MRTKTDYQIIKQVESMDDTSFIKLNDRLYKYRNWIIDYKWDDDYETEEEYF